MSLSGLLRNTVTRIKTRLNHYVTDRKLTVITAHNVRHVTLSRKTQWVAITSTFVLFLWLSFATGTIIAYNEIVSTSNARMAHLTFQNSSLERQYAIKQFTSANIETSYDDSEDDIYNVDHTTYLVNKPLPDNDPVMQRIAFLENKVEELEDYKTHFLTALKEKTSTQISHLEKAIELSGIKHDDLKKHASYVPKPEINDKTAELATEEEGGQGGPYEPWDSSMDPSLEESVLQAVSYMTHLQSVADALPLSYPMESFKMTSRYGKRQDPFKHKWSFHRGVDFAGKSGSKVLSTANGTIKSAGWKSSYGRAVDIQHEFGLMTRYAHLSKILVKPGQEVRKGDVIGIQGSSGRSTGAHLHYEVHQNKATLNPRKFLKAADYVLQKQDD